MNKLLITLAAMLSIMSFSAHASDVKVKKNGEITVWGLDGGITPNSWDNGYSNGYSQGYELGFSYGEIEGIKKMQKEIAKVQAKLDAQLAAKAKLAKKYGLSKKNPHYSDIENAIKAESIATTKWAIDDLISKFAGSQTASVNEDGEVAVNGGVIGEYEAIGEVYSLASPNLADDILGSINDAVTDAIEAIYEKALLDLKDYI